MFSRPAAPVFPIVLLAITCSASIPALAEAEPTEGEWEVDLKNPLTITPFQTATFVPDPEAAQLLNGLAEFSARLLRWQDTPRLPTTMASRIVRTSLGIFGRHYRKPAGPPPTAAVIEASVSSAYRSLESARIVRIDVDQEISVGPTVPIDVAEGVTRVPFVVTNARSSAATVTIQSGTGSRAREIHRATFRAGQTLGFFLTLRPEDAATSFSLTVGVDVLRRQVTLPVRRWVSGSVEVRVVDEKGEPTPARVYLWGADGRSYAPDGVMHQIVTGDYNQPFAGENYFYANGNFEVRLPAGPATIEVVKGMEYLPQRRSLVVPAGGRRTHTLRLARHADLAREGWHSGDAHVHANLFAERRISPRDALLVAKAEDLNVLNILACNDPRTDTMNDIEYFEGKPHAVSESKYIVYFSEEMRNDLYGHVGFIGLKRFVEPAYSGWPRSRYPYDSIPNYYQAKQARAQGAMVTYVHPFLPTEYPVDIALGVADTIDVLSQGDEERNTADWYRLLNCGFRCPISAGTDSFLNIPVHLVPGAGRVYVQSHPALTYDGWLEGYRQGRSFATNGPLVKLSVNGRGPGDELRASAGPLRIEVEGAADSIVPMDSLEIIVNGRVARRVEAGPDRMRLRIRASLEVSASAWVAMRVRGPGHRLVPNDANVYAHTSPVYISIGGEPVAVRDDALYFVRQIDALIARTNGGVFEDAERKQRVIDLFRQGQDVYRKIAEKARN